MHDDIEQEFWHDEPTGRLARIRANGTGPVRITHHTSGAGSRQHAELAKPHRQRPVPNRSEVGGQRPAVPIDPLLRRLAIMIGAIVLLVPVALSLRSGNEAQAAGLATLPAAGGPRAGLEVITPATTPVTTPATPPVTTPGLPIVSTLRVHALKRCDNPYTVAAGDYWIRLAHAIEVPLRDLLALNAATVVTPLYPGRSICLPAGTTISAVPRSTTTTTTTTPSSKKKKTATTSTTTKPAPPVSTEPPVTAPPNHYSAGEAEAIIREIWPDDLEDEAVRIASRESHLVPTARNSCCIGLFQIYYSVHRGWLATIGVTSSAQLFDPRLNAQAALTLYQRSGGWGAWGG
jgi:hypothetical protein